MSKSYLIAPLQTVRVKIGRSIHPENRLRTLQTGSSDRLLLLATSDISETLLHARYKQYRQGDGGSEFFNLPLDKFVELVVEFYQDSPSGISQPKDKPRIEVDWSKVSGERSRHGQYYTMSELQEISRQFDINPSGLKKFQLAREILKHQPTPTVTSIPVRPGEPKSFFASLFEMVFS